MQLRDGIKLLLSNNITLHQHVRYLKVQCILEQLPIGSFLLHNTCLGYLYCNSTITVKLLPVRRDITILGVKVPLNPNQPTLIVDFQVNLC